MRSAQSKRLEEGFIYRESVRAMTNADDIEVEFNDRAIVRGRLQLFRPADAIDLIHRCNTAGVRVLGIDAFLVGPDWIQPSMEHSIDFSSEHQAELLKNSWQHAERFVREREATPFLFEVVMDRSRSVSIHSSHVATSLPSETKSR
jgi:hypothetical protein